MAADSTRVLTLDGVYAKLSNLGFPVSLSVEMQSRGLKLDSSNWTVRLSDEGFSISLFWPHSKGQLVPARRKKRRAKVSAKHSVPLIKSTSKTGNNSQSEYQLPAKTVEHEVSCLPDADAGPCQSPLQLGKLPQGSPVDLKACDVVTYESKDGLPGVRFVDNNNTEDWITVRRKPRRRRPSPANSETYSDASDIVIPPNASVVYTPGYDGAPGLQVNTKKTREWIPVITPVVSRTRSRFKS